MSHPNYTIRRAQPADADPLAACIDAAYAMYRRRISDLPPVSEGCAEDIANHRVWVAARDGEIAGGLVLVLEDRVAKLANVAVHPGHAGQGLGRAFIAQAEAEAERSGCTEIRLNTHIDMPENLRFYSRLGWKEVSRHGTTVSMLKLL